MISDARRQRVQAAVMLRSDRSSTVKSPPHPHRKLGVCIAIFLPMLSKSLCFTTAPTVALKATDMDGESVPWQTSAEPALILLGQKKRRRRAIGLRDDPERDALQ